MTTVRIRFEKVQEASYISLLDMQRVMQRVLKRSGVPVWYTLGFNPHIYMTFSCPLPLGQESLCESVDVKTEAQAPDLAAWQQALNRVIDDYEGYCSRVQQAVKNMSVEENNDLLVTALRQRLALKEETK